MSGKEGEEKRIEIDQKKKAEVVKYKVASVFSTGGTTRF